MDIFIILEKNLLYATLLRGRILEHQPQAESYGTSEYTIVPIFHGPYDRTDLFNLDQSSRAQCKSKIVFFKNLTSSLIGNSTWI